MQREFNGIITFKIENRFLHLKEKSIITLTGNNALWS